MRKTKEIRIPARDGNRDSGKLFVVTEMSALAAEKWGRDAFRSLARGGMDVMPDELESASLNMLAGYGFRALAASPIDEIDGLMTRLMACVEYVPDPTRPEVRRVPTGFPPFENDIEEIGTRLRLQKEAFELSLGFSLPAVSSESPPQGETTPTP